MILCAGDYTIISPSGTTVPRVIAGPRFVKEDFLIFIGVTMPISQDGACRLKQEEWGVERYRMSSGRGFSIVSMRRSSWAARCRIMEENLTRIGTNGPIAYGIDEVEEAIACGAVEHILVIDEMIRDDNISAILEAGEAVRASIVVFSSEFEPGKQLEALGGIAALLRSKIK